MQEIRTYLSIDCDYFVHQDTYTPVETAEFLAKILKSFNLPIYVTLGHDLHAFDVNRHRVNKIINIDEHCDVQCTHGKEYYSEIRGHKRLLRNTPNPLKMLDLLVEHGLGLDEWNWIHWCVLSNNSPKIEHWRPCHSADCIYSRRIISTLSGYVPYRNRVVNIQHLEKRIDVIRHEVVAIGLAISPDWCTYDVWDEAQTHEFFKRLYHRRIITDRTYYRLFWEPHYQDTFPFEEVTLVGSRKRSVVMTPPRWRILDEFKYYELIRGDIFVPVRVCNVKPHLPSIKRAAHAFLHWNL